MGIVSRLGKFLPSLFFSRADSLRKETGVKRHVIFGGAAARSTINNDHHRALVA
jgi:hypothetical protein